MYYQRLRTEGRPTAPAEERLLLFLAGDDEEAKCAVSRVIEEIGFTPVDTGSLSESRKQEPGSPIYNVPMRRQQARDVGRYCLMRPGFSREKVHFKRYTLYTQTLRGDETRIWR